MLHRLEAQYEAAHPRVSGENSLLEHAAATHPGSSPRERGKLKKTLHVAAPEWLIPA